MSPEVRLELLRLLSALCDGGLTEVQHRRLEELLDADAECRRLYLQYTDMHARLLVRPPGRQLRRLPGKQPAAVWDALNKYHPGKVRSLHQHSHRRVAVDYSAVAIAARTPVMLMVTPLVATTGRQPFNRQSRSTPW
jgi:hypothetical protein